MLAELKDKLRQMTLPAFEYHALRTAQTLEKILPEQPVRIPLTDGNLMTVWRHHDAIHHADHVQLSIEGVGPKSYRHTQIEYRLNGRSSGLVRFNEQSTENNDSLLVERTSDQKNPFTVRRTYQDEPVPVSGSFDEATKTEVYSRVALHFEKALTALSHPQ